MYHQVFFHSHSLQLRINRSHQYTTSAALCTVHAHLQAGDYYHHIRFDRSSAGSSGLYTRYKSYNGPFCSFHLLPFHQAVNILPPREFISV